MLNNLLLPFDQHFDDGFHAVGRAFKESADRLATSGEENFSFSNSHLPINYLYRHSIELFLKSAILTIHRALQLRNGDGKESKYPVHRTIWGDFEMPDGIWI